MKFLFASFYCEDFVSQKYMSELPCFILPPPPFPLPDVPPDVEGHKDRAKSGRPHGKGGVTTTDCSFDNLHVLSVLISFLVSTVF